MPWDYNDEQKQIQEKFDSVRMATRLIEKTYQEELDGSDISLITSQRMFFLATADREGEPYCTFRGGDPGFVKVIDSTTLAWPEYDGNGMFLAVGNIAANPKVHLLFIDWENQRRIRVAGDAALVFDGPLVSEWHKAKLAVVVKVTRAFPNCKRYIPKMAVVEESRHVPRQGTATPVADWKREDWVCDALPQDDPARDPSAPQ